MFGSVRGSLTANRLYQ